jgi:hypothetical protein
MQAQSELVSARDNCCEWGNRERRERENERVRVRERERSTYLYVGKNAI